MGGARGEGGTNEDGQQWKKSILEAEDDHEIWDTGHTTLRRANKNTD